METQIFFFLVLFNSWFQVFSSELKTAWHSKILSIIIIIIFFHLFIKKLQLCKQTFTRYPNIQSNCVHKLHNKLFCDEDEPTQTICILASLFYICQKYRVIAPKKKIHTKILLSVFCFVYVFVP